MIVKKEVREFVKRKNLMISEKALSKLETKVEMLINDATVRTIANNRKVLKERDL